jgi:hypothetical protein
VFYFYGHGGFEDITGEPEIVVKTYGLGEEILSPSEISKFIKNGQYKIVFINACYSAQKQDWADAFKINYSSLEALNNECFIGSRTEAYGSGGASLWAQRFWEQLRRNPQQKIYDVAISRLPSTYWLPYGSTTQTWLPNPGANVRYWDFRP